MMYLEPWLMWVIGFVMVLGVFPAVCVGIYYMFWGRKKNGKNGESSSAETEQREKP